MAYKDYNDKAAGMAKISSYSRGTGVVPCEIRWGLHPDKEGYDLCLVLDWHYCGDTKFGISSIDVLDNDDIECTMMGQTKCIDEDVIITGRILVTLMPGEHMKVIQSGIASNVIDICYLDDTGLENNDNSDENLDNSDIDVSSDLEEESTESSTDIVTLFEAVEMDEDMEEDSTQSSEIPMGEDMDEDMDEDSTQSSEIVMTEVSLKRSADHTLNDLDDTSGPTRKKMKWYKPWRWLW